MGGIRVAAAGVVLLMVLSTCAVFCIVSGESTEAFNVSQKDGAIRVDQNVDGVEDQYISEEDEVGTDESNEESTSDDSTMDEQDADQAASVGQQRSGSRFLVEKMKKEGDGGRCWRVKHCSRHHFLKPGCCEKKCVNLDSNAMHCGKCGVKCKVGMRCDEGKCKKLPPSGCGVHGKCKAGFTCCKNKCVKLKGSDKFNCGKCGRKCGFGSVCCTGECKYIYKSDAENCGGCHKECKPGVKCMYGICGYN